MTNLCCQSVPCSQLEGSLPVLQKLGPEFRPAQDSDKFGHQRPTREQLDPLVVREIQNLLRVSARAPPRRRCSSQEPAARRRLSARTRLLLPGSPPSSWVGFCPLPFPGRPAAVRRDEAAAGSPGTSPPPRPEREDQLSASFSRSSGSSRVTAMMFSAPRSRGEPPSYHRLSPGRPARERRRSHRHRPPEADETPRPSYPG